MHWKFKDTTLVDISQLPDNTFGFTYKITHIPTGKAYIGRKNLFTHRNVKLGKKELAALKEERKANKMRGKTPTKKLVVKESDWKTYWGSNKNFLKFIKEEGKENFTREILELATNKKHLTYLETKYLFINEVLEKPEMYMNDNILGKFYSSDFNLEK